MIDIMRILGLLQVILCDIWDPASATQFLPVASYQLPLQKLHLNPGFVFHSPKIKFKWKQIVGQHRPTILDDRQETLVLTNLRMGFYAFQVDMVYPNKSSVVSRILRIQIYDSANKKPRANAGGDRIIHLPTRSVRLMGSHSSDDRGALKYRWVPDESNLAGLEILGNSATEANLLLSNLYPGKYKFKLLVEDEEGLQDEDRMALTIRENINIKNVIEIQFLANLMNFTHNNMKNFESQIYLIISKSLPNMEFHIEVLQLKQDPVTGHALMALYAVYNERNHRRNRNIFHAPSLIKMLRPVIMDDINIFMYPVVQINSLNCSKSCFKHGYCDSGSSRCICDAFWINNIWETWRTGISSGNCEWNVFYVIAASGVTAIILGLLCRMLHQALCRLAFWDDLLLRR